MIINKKNLHQESRIVPVQYKQHHQTIFEETYRRVQDLDLGLNVELNRKVDLELI